MESACVLREGLMSFITSCRLSNQTCCYISSELWKDGQSLFCCCHAVFQGVSRWLNNGVHLCVDVSVGQCTRHNLHRTNHIEISIHSMRCILILPDWFIPCNTITLQQCFENSLIIIYYFLPVEFCRVISVW